MLIEHPKVAEVAVVGIPDRRLDDERICAVVVAKKEQTVSIDELHDFLKTKDMAAYKMPKKLLIIEPTLFANTFGTDQVDSLLVPRPLPSSSVP